VPCQDPSDEAAPAQTPAQTTPPPKNMFKKRSKKRTTKKTSSIHQETEEEAQASSLQPSILEATRAEQAERTKRRAATVVVVSGDGQPNIKRRRVPSKIQPKVQQNDADTDKHMEEYIAQRMGGDGASATGSSSSSSSSSSTTATASITALEKEALDPYGLLRRKSTHLTAEQGGVSDLAGSGIGGIGIYEVELPDAIKKINAEKTLQAIQQASIDSQSHTTTALAGLNLPSSFSGNFIKSQNLLYRGDAVTGPDGTRIVSSTHQFSSKRATDFKALKHFKNSMR